MHEIVTLQFGQQANYLATHFWNTQESYFTYGDQTESPVDHDVHFRPGIGADGSETYTPRTVIYDLKGAFGTLRRDNVLYAGEQAEADIAAASQWPGQPQTIRAPPIPESTYQTALSNGTTLPSLSSSTVRYWSDYLHIYHHPRSIIPLTTHELHSSLTPFDRWSTGAELFDTLGRDDDLLDRDLRPWLEECDALQGVQVLASTDDAWGGFAAGYVERVRDELGKGAVWVFGLEDGTRQTRERTLLGTANKIRSLAALAVSASMVVPLTNQPSRMPGYILRDYDTGSRWYSSALQVAGLESATLSTRLRVSDPARASLDDLEAVLGNGGKRRVAYLEYSASTARDDHRLEATNGVSNGVHDDRIRNGKTNGVAQDEHDFEPAELEFDISLAPEQVKDTHQRGPGSAQQRGEVFSRTVQLRGEYLSTLELEDIRRKSTDRWASSVKANVAQTGLLFPLLSSFPKIYDLQGSERGARSDAVQIKSALSASSGVSRDVRALERVGRRILPVEDREELCEVLLGLAGEYVEGWSGSEGEDDEDEE